MDNDQIQKCAQVSYTGSRKWSESDIHTLESTVYLQMISTWVHDKSDYPAQSLAEEHCATVDLRKYHQQRQLLQTWFMFPLSMYETPVSRLASKDLLSRPFTNIIYNQVQMMIKNISFQ